MSYILAAAGILAGIGLIALIPKWRRSRKHIGISHPTIEQGSVKYKQVIVPGADPDRIAQPSGEVEDVLAVRPGAPEPGQTFTPAPAAPEQTQNPPDPPTA